MNRLKVMTIVGTRPEIIRLSRVIDRLDQSCDQCLVHTGQNHDYELNEIFFEQLKIRRPDVFLEASGDTAAKTIGRVITATDQVLRKRRPEAVLLLGDTNSCLAAIAAKRLRIPVFHMEAGNRCFDSRVPEEINRRIVDHVADIHLTYSDIARSYLLREGIAPDQIVKTGSPMLEVLNYYMEDIKKSDVLGQLSLERGKYFVMSAHREENVDPPDKMTRIAEIANHIAQEHDIPLIVSTHPRTRSRLNSLNLRMNSKVHFSKPFGFLDYVHLQMNAKAVLSDSGTITEESSILNFPALNLREAHERPEGMEEGAVMMVGLDIDRVCQGLAILESQSCGAERRLRLVADYDIPNVSEKVVRIIHSYTDYVNRVVWKKY
ncbi:UDP-N-acetylglucosamine 2-epimerase (non-hydrolyzing) [Mesorhizobium hawassense]|uniref:UDP-N-acetylglucosamine 2-epimerase (Non-hydrolyzing) n=1 Tax=Mesorhizobium hawassense TaxID=1209954 RepID=A0A330HZP8_9HYPH|nr:UDP-N-acetylglucosamine 2-epimerase (non-hydrolyzing) [Mesorhizobium hawassense]RAZ92239.1 UDP-N-acetylglucosamine 2-epimerase (non-hydrolyzing) [Mesorhizobium hawassense]